MICTTSSPMAMLVMLKLSNFYVDLFFLENLISHYLFFYFYFYGLLFGINKICVFIFILLAFNQVEINAMFVFFGLFRYGKYIKTIN